MYRFDSGAIGVCENVWCMPDHKGYFPDERMEIIGTEGGIYLQETYPALSVVDKQGSYTPDPTYWPELRPGVRGGALAGTELPDLHSQRHASSVITPSR
jgi:predicted dehydrogenase